jgi:hypothetical protein
MSEVRPGSFVWRLCPISHPNRPQASIIELLPVTANGGWNLVGAAEQKLALDRLTPGKSGLERFIA